MARGGIVAAIAVVTSLSVHGGAQSVSPDVEIAGRIVVASTGDPLPNVRVTLVPATADTPVVVTDESGRFTIAATARQRLVISKAGYARTELGAASGAPLTIGLHAAAVITGRIVDESGEPAINTRVVVERAGAESHAVIAAGQTDDRGDYRLGDLPAGAFIVAAVRAATTVVNGQPLGADTRYFPGTTARAEADPVTVQEGAEASGIDIVSPLPPGAIPGTSIVRMAVLLAPASSDEHQAGRGAIAGRVAAVDGQPVPRATIVLAMSGSRFITAPLRTDDAGRFRFADLPAGHFLITVYRLGYLGVASGPTREIGLGEGSQREVTVDDGESREDADIAMVRSAVVSGHVLDERGEPVEHVTVQLLQPRYDRGRRRLMPAGFPRQTDDRGAFRLYGIRPGRYVVSASPDGAGQLPGYARSWFPATIDPVDAQVIDLTAGEELSAIDISLARERTFSISGTLTDSSGQPTTGGSLQLLPSVRSGSVVGASIGARITEGRFVFVGVPPGAYVIRADRGRSQRSVEGEFGTAAVTVIDRDVTGVVLQTSAGSTIAGRITFAAAAARDRPQASRIEISPVPIDFDNAPGQPASADIHDDWTFEMRGINGARLLEVRRVPDGWALEEIRVNGIDAADRPLAFGRTGQSVSDVEIVLTDRVSTLKGTVADDRGAPASSARVVVFATDPDRWYSGSRFLRVAATGDDGTFTVPSLAPASYYVAAVNTIPEDGDEAWQDPSYLEMLMMNATTVTIADGESRSVSLRVR